MFVTLKHIFQNSFFRSLYFSIKSIGNVGACIFFFSLVLLKSLCKLYGVFSCEFSSISCKIVVIMCIVFYFWSFGRTRNSEGVIVIHSYSLLIFQSSFFGYLYIEVISIFFFLCLTINKKKKLHRPVLPAQCFPLLIMARVANPCSSVCSDSRHLSSLLEPDVGADAFSVDVDIQPIEVSILDVNQASIYQIYINVYYEKQTKLRRETKNRYDR